LQVEVCDALVTMAAGSEKTARIATEGTHHDRRHMAQQSSTRRDASEAGYRYFSTCILEDSSEVMSTMPARVRMIANV